MKKYERVNEYITSNKHWGDALKKLRRIVIKTELEETIKWGAPAYTYDDKNIVGLGAFKSYVGLWFFQGALLKDSKKKLVNAQEGVTRALRQMRFNSVDEINEKVILEYVKEAIKNQKAGKEIKPTKKSKFTIPKELDNKIKKNAGLKESFYKLTPFKQREYSEYISQAKREVTKKSRLEKIIPMILNGIGLNDKYR
ncbi:MAG: hypothetical protein HKM87_06225 [Ignavibacteriaceae bacterium]|nr:hypothetical protein [Ignavibacteriaceae bacterium]